MAESERPDSASDDAEPPPLLAYAAPDLQPNRRATIVAQWCGWIAAMICGFGAGYIVFFSVLSVMILGPLLLLCAAIMLAASLLARWPGAAGLAAGHMGVCLLFFGLVMLLNWSPAQASRPFAWMSVLWTIAAVAASAVVLRSKATPASASSRA